MIALRQSKLFLLGGIDHVIYFCFLQCLKMETEVINDWIRITIYTHTMKVYVGYSTSLFLYSYGTQMENDACEPLVVTFYMIMQFITLHGHKVTGSTKINGSPQSTDSTRALACKYASSAIATDLCVSLGLFWNHFPVLLNIMLVDIYTTVRYKSNIEHLNVFNIAAKSAKDEGAISFYGIIRNRMASIW